jgi:Amt family ammonium transporter
MAMRRKYFLPFVLLMVVVIAGAFNPGQVMTGSSVGKIDTGDMAWMLVSCALVMIMTPGLGFFLRWFGE